MPRAPRIDFPDALYHVMSRGNARQDIFWTDDECRTKSAGLKMMSRRNREGDEGYE